MIIKWIDLFSHGEPDVGIPHIRARIELYNIGDLSSFEESEQKEIIKDFREKIENAFSILEYDTKLTVSFDFEFLIDEEGERSCQIK